MTVAALKRDRVVVDGLAELRRELRKLDLTNDLKQANYDVAKHVADESRLKARTVGPMQRKAAETLAAGRQQARAVVSFGGRKAPFAGGAEFGAQSGQPRRLKSGRTVKGWNQFEPWRGAGPNAGYFLYPTIRDETRAIVEMYGDAIEKLTAKAFPD